jgi:hypothetical protein
VVRLIGERLISGQTVTDSRIGLGERLGAVVAGAATVVGSAASMAISAPVAILDADTRKNYGDQVKRLGQSLNDTAGATADAIPLPAGQKVAPVGESQAAASR